MIVRVVKEWKIKKLPERCKECCFFHTVGYTDNNDRGEMGDCKLGFMDAQDTRDFSGRTKWPACRIEELIVEEVE